MSWTTKCLLFCERSPDTYLEILPKNPESTSDTKQTCTQAKEFPKQPAPFKPKALKHDSTNHRHPPGPRPPTIPSAPSAGRTESTNEAERTMHQTDHAAGRTIPARRRAIWCVSCVSHVETGFGSSDTLHPCRLVHTPSQDTTWPSPAQRLASRAGGWLRRCPGRFGLEVNPVCKRASKETVSWNNMHQNNTCGQRARLVVVKLFHPER